jgi:hypothetical protein
MRSTIAKAPGRFAKQLPGRSSKAPSAEASKRAAQAMAAGAAGAVASFFLDPQSGKRRRHVAVDRVAALMRHRAADADRRARYMAGQAKGMAHRVTSSDGRDPSELNDTALARKVETEIFRGADVPKGSINVNAENGVIYLRGEVKQPEQVEKLGQAAREIDGVREVKNLLHTPS